MNRIEHGQRVSEPRHVPRAPLDILASCAGMIASEADHLGREIDRRHPRAALGKRDGPLATATAGVEVVVASAFRTVKARRSCEDSLARSVLDLPERAAKATNRPVRGRHM